MDLHGMARGQVSAVNPETAAVLYQSTGYLTNADGSRSPQYQITSANLQVQALSTDDLKHVNSLNITGIVRKVYLPGSQWSSVVRAALRGGDIFVFGGHEWLVSTVSESWPDWASVIVTQQIEQTFQAPTVVGFVPASGPAGTTLVVTGTHLVGTYDVVLNSSAHSVPGVALHPVFRVVSDTQMLVSFPDSTALVDTLWDLSVVSPGGTAAAPTPFTLTYPAPPATGGSFIVMPASYPTFVNMFAGDPYDYEFGLSVFELNGPMTAVATYLYGMTNQGRIYEESFVVDVSAFSQQIVGTGDYFAMFRATSLVSPNSGAAVYDLAITIDDAVIGPVTQHVEVVIGWEPQ